MNLDFSAQDEAFRAEVRLFIKENYPGELRQAQKGKQELNREERVAWQRILAKRGWAAPNGFVKLTKLAAICL